MLLATITITQILEILALIIVVHAVILAPLIVAIVGVYREHVENEEYRQRRANLRAL